MKCGCVTGQYKYLWHDWVSDEVNDNGDDEPVYKSSRDFLGLKNAIAPHQRFPILISILWKAAATAAFTLEKC